MSKIGERTHGSKPSGTQDDEDPVARAEQALANLSEQFATWMEDESARLDDARGEIRRLGLSRATAETLFKAAHDIKGEAATLGYPLVESAAASLCGLILHARNKPKIPLALIDLHVDAALTIMRAHGRADAAELADRLMRDVTQETTAYLLNEDAGALDTIEFIESPPIAP